MDWERQNKNRTGSDLQTETEWRPERPEGHRVRWTAKRRSKRRNGAGGCEWTPCWVADGGWSGDGLGPVFLPRSANCALPTSWELFDWLQKGCCCSLWSQEPSEGETVLWPLAGASCLAIVGRRDEGSKTKTPLHFESVVVDDAPLGQAMTALKGTKRIGSHNCTSAASPLTPRHCCTTTNVNR